MNRWSNRLYLAGCSLSTTSWPWPIYGCRIKLFFQLETLVWLLGLASRKQLFAARARRSPKRLGRGYSKRPLGRRLVNQLNLCSANSWYVLSTLGSNWMRAPNAKLKSRICPVEFCFSLRFKSKEQSDFTRFLAIYKLPNVIHGPSDIGGWSMFKLQTEEPQSSSLIMHSNPSAVFHLETHRATRRARWSVSLQMERSLFVHFD